MDLKEREINALERIGDALHWIARVFQSEFDQKYPLRPVPTDATQTRIHDDENTLRESQGDTGEVDDQDWLTLKPSPFDNEIGPREAKAAEAPAKDDQASGRAKTSRRAKRTG